MSFVIIDTTAAVVKPQDDCAAVNFVQSQVADPSMTMRDFGASSVGVCLARLCYSMRAAAERSEDGVWG